MLVLACLGQGRESVSKQHFLVVVPQPVGFWRSETLVHFPTLSMSFLTQHFLAKCSFHSSVGSLNVVMLKRKTDQNRTPSHQYRKIQKHIQWPDFQRGIHQTNVHLLWILHSRYTIIWWCSVGWSSFSVVYAGRYDEVDACSVHLFVITTCALRLKSYHYTWNQISLLFFLVKVWQLCLHDYRNGWCRKKWF